MFHLFYIKKNLFILLNMPGSELESEQDCERKLHSLRYLRYTAKKE